MLNTLWAQLNSISEHHSLQAVVNSRLQNHGDTFIAQSRIGLDSLAADKSMKQQLLNHSRSLDAIQYAQELC